MVLGARIPRVDTRGQTECHSFGVNTKLDGWLGSNRLRFAPRTLGEWPGLLVARVAQRQEELTADVTSITRPVAAAQPGQCQPLTPGPSPASPASAA